MDTIMEWDENTPILWWKAGRIKVNKVIRKYNKWVCRHMNDEEKTAKLLSKINRHLMKPYANRDGGGSWRDDLLLMKDNVEEHQKQQ